MILVNNRDKIEWQENMTVRDLLNIMGYDYALITVTVGETYVPEEDYDTFLIPDNVNVTFFHLAHGG
jgi:thiamine biosynthesis protein ThiS